jgi:hypothetical protein
MSIKSFACLLLLGLITPAVAFAQGKAAAPGKGADACTLVSKAEIEDAIGLKLQDGKKDPKMQNPGVLSSCDYSTQSGGQVSILIRQNPTKYAPGTEKAEFEKQGMKLKYATGLGTTAFFIDMFGMGTSLGVFRGDYDYVQLSAMGTGGAEAARSAALAKAAKLVLDRWK